MTDPTRRAGSFRPKFRVHWSVSLLGAIGCGAVMFLINAVATAVAIITVAGIYFWLERKKLRSEWGHVRRGIWMTLTRTGLFRLRDTPDPKNWRPHILVLSGAPTRRWHLIELASAISHNRALMTVSTLVTSTSFDKKRIAMLESTIIEFMERRGVRCLVRAVSAKTPFDGETALLDVYGLGTLVPNTILLGDSESRERRGDYCRMIDHFYWSKRNTAIVRYNDTRGFGDRRNIDVWWGGLRGNGSLMMILAYLLSTSLSWRGAKSDSQDGDPVCGRCTNRQPESPAPRRGLPDGRGQQRHRLGGSDLRDEILHESSAKADLIFMGMAEPRTSFVEYYERLQGRLNGLSTKFLVLSAEDVSFGDVLIEKEQALQEDARAARH